MATRSSGQARPLKLIYVHGTNGSGKSTLARYLLMCAGGIKDIKPHAATGAHCTYSWRRLACVGKYRALTGGADGVQPYALVPTTALALLKDGYDVLVEGLMSPGVETCKTLTRKAQKLGASVRFIRLDIGFYQCCGGACWRATRRSTTPATCARSNEAVTGGSRTSRRRACPSTASGGTMP